MDFPLRCNSLSCRADLTERAVVTTCSHIFCEGCAAQLGLSDNARGRSCPACETPLQNQDDAVVTSLNPAEDYKTSVLSGLSPTTIMECASRGVAFFQYQATQELYAIKQYVAMSADGSSVYQNHLVKNISAKHSNMSSQLDSVILEANSEIQNLHQQLQAALSDRTELERKNQELVDAFKEKSKAQQQLQVLYQKLKGRVNAAAVEDGASHNVDSILNAARAPQMPQMPQSAHTRTGRSPNLMLQQMPARGGSIVHGGNIVPGTPAHRQQLGMTANSNIGAGLRQNNSRISGLGQGILHPTPSRQPLRDIDANVVPQNAHSMSAGARMSRPLGTANSSRLPGVKGFGAGIFGMRQ